MSDLQIRTFADRASLDKALAEGVAEGLRRALDERGEGSLIVSGGSTPKQFFRLLSQQLLQWSKLTVTLADERWVPADHADSNERLVREQLLSGDARAARFISLVNDDEHPQTAQAEIAARLANLGTVDVTVLGMGADGHFASLFPDSDSLAEGLNPGNSNSCIAVDPPHALHARMSMTLARLCNTRELILHIVGDEKKEVLNKAAGGVAMTYPIAALLQSRTPPVQIYWAP